MCSGVEYAPPAADTVLLTGTVKVGGCSRYSRLQLTMIMIEIETAGCLPGIEVGPEAQLGEWTTTRVAGLAPPLWLKLLASPH